MQDTKRSELNAYLTKGIHDVPGWCIPQLWQSIWPLYERIGDGPVAEIGVYQGKFFIGLAKTFSSPSGHVAIDVFDMQQFNIGGAGEGNKELFLQNLMAQGVDANDLHLMTRDSLSLDIRDTTEMLERFGGFRFFSIDGCHEVLHTTNDIEFAMSVTHPQGIIAVDDYMNAHWPGVMEAVAKMYLLREFAFVPLLFTCNKLLLCSRSVLDDYREHVASHIAAHFPETRMKEVVRFGYKTLTIIPNFAKWTDL